MKCYECGGEVVLIQKKFIPYDRINIKNVYLLNAEVEYCRSCGNESPVLRRIKDVHSKIALALALQPGRLNAAEVRFIRKAMRLSSEEMAKRVDLAPETYSRWENGRLPGHATERVFRLNFLAFIGHNEGFGEVLANDFSFDRNYGLVLDITDQEGKVEYVSLNSVFAEVPTKSKVPAHTSMPLELAKVVGIRSVAIGRFNQLQSEEGDMFDAGTFAVAA